MSTYIHVKNIGPSDCLLVEEGVLTRIWSSCDSVLKVNLDV